MVLGNDANAIARAVVDERLNHRFDRLQAVHALTASLKILRLHRTGKIDREDDIVALRPDLAAILDALRAGKGKNHEDQPRHGQATRPARSVHHRGPVPARRERYNQDRQLSPATQGRDGRNQQPGEQPKRVL